MTLFNAPIHNYSPLGKVEIRQTRIKIKKQALFKCLLYLKGN